jgi:tRNA nucleotidyltransferase (CCA-adding enzyme)
MTKFHPDAMTPALLQDLRHAAEQAYGEDVRHPSYQGHPEPSQGCCYVAAEWLKSRLGGHVATKKGHYFWLSQDKEYVIDLTGDQFAEPPVDPRLEGTPDEEGEPIELESHHRVWHAGPTMFKRSTHPLYRGFRIVDSHGADDRVSKFTQRADAALAGKTVHKADLMGADAFPGSTPQKQEDWSMGGPLGPVVHDEPDYKPNSTLQEYKFVWANGQLHVSPVHSHEELAGHAGHDGAGPFAVGYAEVQQGHVMWSVESNIGLNGLAEQLKDYSENVGWHWDGMTDSKGQMLDDEFGPKTSMWFAPRADGHLILSPKPLPHGDKINIQGRTAHVAKITPALSEWADDFRYKLAEYPGGGNMVDMIKVRPNDDLFNNVNQDHTPEKADSDLDMRGDLRCGTCGEHFGDTNELLLHRKVNHEQETENRIEDGKFPWPPGFNPSQQNPGFGTIPVPNSGETIASVRNIGSWETKRFSGHDAMWLSTARQPLSHYGAFHRGQMVGYAISTNWKGREYVTEMHSHARFASRALIGLIHAQHPGFEFVATRESPEELQSYGLYNTHDRRFEAAVQQTPKDMIAEPIPFIYDIKGDKDHKMGLISLGYAGEKTHDVQPSGGGHFTPGGIIEGYYQPGGKILLVSMTNQPFTVRTFAQLWYSQFPQMEISSVEIEKPDGKTQKVASADVGATIRALAAGDQAVQGAYQALKYAGGKVYVVGGAVRDVMQGRDPKDIDMMVAGVPPEQVDHILSQLPGRVDLTGKRFGVYRYRVNGQEVEIALPRQDKYETSRRGEGVITVDHQLPVEKDLERRDFTANSMAVDLDSGKLIDPYNGAKDIENNVLRTTHPDSFREDPTRLVRALTASSRFGLHPDEKTRHEMEASAHLLKHESPDALNKILDKTFASENPAGAMRLGQETGILQHIFPEVANNWDFDQQNKHHKYPLGDHLMSVLDNTSRLTKDPDVRMAAMLHDVGKPASAWTDPATGQGHYYYNVKTGEGADHETVGAQMAEQRMRSLNYPTARINRVKHLVQHHMFPAFGTPKGARKFLQRVGDQHADDLLNLRQADQTGKGQTPEEIAARTSVDQQRQLVDESRKQQAPSDLSNLAINGNDLLAMGHPPGAPVGNTLRSLLNDVVDDPSLNTPEALTQHAQGYIDASTQP